MNVIVAIVVWTRHMKKRPLRRLVMRLLLARRMAISDSPLDDHELKHHDRQVAPQRYIRLLVDVCSTCKDDLTQGGWNVVKRD